MDPIYPWLDPIEVRHLADQLMRPHQEPAANLTDPGFDEGFVGYASEPPARSFTPPPESPTPQVESPFRQEPPPPAPPVENTSGARGPFLERIKLFTQWMRHHFSATGIFILDREGAVIFDESSHGRLHFLARSLALASRRPRATPGNVHVKIGAGATLEVIPVDTAYGCLVLGAVVPEFLPPDSVLAVMEALSQVASPPAES
jgi:hypothetical protein